MEVHERCERLPFTAEQLYRLVIDVERYPEFVPGYRKARIVDAGEQWIEVSQEVGAGPLNTTFRSVARLNPPHSVMIHCTDGPFSELRIEWRFEPVEGGCRVDFCSGYEPGAHPIGMVLGSWVSHSADRMLEAFRRRAEEVYGSL